MYSLLTEHIEIDREQRSVRCDGETIHLTGLEYGLLDYLSSHANRICTREAILDHVWGKTFRYDTGTIDVHLNALRRKLGFSRSHPIETIRSIGFVFHIEQAATLYTIDLQAFLIEWLRRHDAEITAKGLVAQMHLTPFVNEITIEPKAMRQMLDSVLSALLPSSQPGILRLSSKLTIQYFILSLEINGTINELRIPIYGDFAES
ncbi:MAG: winged helix-turn-helix transcriptional regulator [Paludibacteraceae bacterium]|nr:winged helix-turn-helix transcriptional regulator [Paludibacteraceae bacterium]